MVLIGLLLIAAAVAAAIILVVQNDNLITIHVFDADYSVAAYWLAIAGLAIMAVLALGLVTLRVGAAHRIRRRRERRELMRENRLLSERAAAADGAGVGQPSTRVAPGTTAGHPTGHPTAGGGLHSEGAHAEPVRSRGDDPGRTPAQG